MTAGLKPDPRMGDSGVPWRGEVPGHWADLSHAPRTQVSGGTATLGWGTESRWDRGGTP